MIPPGPYYFLTFLPPLLTPPLLVALFLHAIGLTLSVTGPAWTTTLLTILSFPILFVLKVQFRAYIDRRTAAAHGAVLPPAITSSWLWGGCGAGIDIVFRSVRDLKTGFPGQLLALRCEEMGTNTFAVPIGWENRVFTAEPAYIKSILSTDFTSFEKGKWFRDVFHPLLGTGVFNSDGAMWKFHRDMTRPFFEKSRIHDFEILDSRVEDAIGQIRACVREGEAFDFQELIGRLTLDCASAFLFGHDFHSLAEPLSRPFYSYSAPAPSSPSPSSATPASFAPAFLAAQDIAAVRIRYAAHWPLAEFWRDTMHAPMRVVGDVLDPILKRVVEEHKHGKATGSENGRKESGTLLEHLVAYTDDIKLLRDELLNMSVAGRDTVTCLTTFTVYMLAEHPAVLAKVRAEVLEVVGGRGRPTPEDIKRMPYLRAVLNETLRLYPPVPLNFRTSVKGVIWPPVRPGDKPLYIPPNTMIPYGPIVMHRRKDLWGEDALEWDPERWIDARRLRCAKNPFMFLPFNAGPRICLGQQFAYHESSFIVIRLLQAFSKIRLAPEAQPPETRVPDEWRTEAGDPTGWKRHEKVHPKASLTLFVAGGLWVTMEE